MVFYPSSFPVCPVRVAVVRAAAPGDQGRGRRPGGRPGECAGGERCRPCSGPVAGEVTAARPGAGRREGGGGVPGRGGTRDGAGGGGDGGSLKDAEMIASNSASSHCGSAQIRSANAASASRVERTMPITLPGTCGSITRLMTDTLFI